MSRKVYAQLTVLKALVTRLTNAKWHPVDAHDFSLSQKVRVILFLFQLD
jgi:hypothetical protein